MFAGFLGLAGFCLCAKGSLFAFGHAVKGGVFHHEMQTLVVFRFWFNGSKNFGTPVA
jgi:hypothetical protein